MAEKEPKVFLNRAEEIAYEREQRGRQDGETHGDILPLRRNKNGKLEFAIPQFLLDMYNSFTLPSDVTQGYKPSDEEIAEFAGNVGLAGVGTSAKAAKEAGPNALGMFLGFKSHGADLAKLAKATSLQSKGASREEIWDATGWWKGKDNEWRYELSDENFDLTPEARKALDAEQDYTNPVIEGNVEDIFYHPDLYRNYDKNDVARPMVPEREKPVDPYAEGSFEQRPFIKEQHDSKARISRAQPGYATGSYSPDTDSYKASGYDDDALLRTALHELQHGVQMREGFGRGSSENEIAGVMSRYMQELPEDVFRYWELDNLAKNNPDDPAIQKNFERAKSYIAPYKKEADEFINFLSKSAWENYRAVDGEAEANLTASRKNFTDADRKMIPPWMMYEHLDGFSVKEEDVWNPVDMAQRFEKLKELAAKAGAPIQQFAEGGQVIDPVSGNEVPPGSDPENVRDDVPIMASEGEYVIPADVVRFLGLDKIESLINKAKEGLKDLEAQGRIGGDAPDEDALPFDEAELLSVSDEGAGPVPEVAAFAEGGQVQKPGGENVNEVRTFKNSDGRVISIPFFNGQPLFSIPGGYTEMNASQVDEKAPDPQANVDTGKTAAPGQPAYQQQAGDNNREVPGSRLAGDPKDWTVQDFINYGKQQDDMGSKVVKGIASFMPLANIGMKLRDRYLDKTTAGMFDQMLETGLDLQGNPIEPAQKTLLQATADSLKQEMADETGLDLSPSKKVGEAFDRFSNFVGGMVGRRSSEQAPRDAISPEARQSSGSQGFAKPAAPSESYVPERGSSNDNPSDPNQRDMGQSYGGGYGGLYKKGGYVTRRKKG